MLYQPTLSLGEISNAPPTEIDRWEGVGRHEVGKQVESLGDWGSTKVALADRYRLCGLNESIGEGDISAAGGLSVASGFACSKTPRIEVAQAESSGHLPFIILLPPSGGGG